MKVKYINKDMSGLIKGHEYDVHFREPNKKSYVYDAHIFYDITENKSVDIFVQYASINSINRNFEYKSFILEG